MQRTILNIDTWYSATVREHAAPAILLAACFPASTLAQQHGSKDVFVTGRSEQRLGFRHAE
jgi:hypothetical protein